MKLQATWHDVSNIMLPVESDKQMVQFYQECCAFCTHSKAYWIVLFLKLCIWVCILMLWETLVCLSDEFNKDFEKLCAS